jgi:hypothetical protein
MLTWAVITDLLPCGELDSGLVLEAFGPETSALQ